MGNPARPTTGWIRPKADIGDRQDAGKLSGSINRKIEFPSLPGPCAKDWRWRRKPAKSIGLVSSGFHGNSCAQRAPVSINSSAEASLTAACRQSLSSRNGSRDNGTGSAENSAVPVSASPSEISALASGIVMPVQGNRSHASSKLQVTICSLLHPKKSTGIMCASMVSLSGKLHGDLGPLLADSGLSENKCLATCRQKTYGCYPQRQVKCTENSVAMM